MKGVGVKEASPWISIACSALVWLGSLARFSGREQPPRPTDQEEEEEEEEEEEGEEAEPVVCPPALLVAPGHVDR